MKAVIIDYRMGNLRSVQKALECLGGEAQITSDPNVIAAAPRLILPGVGAFGDGMAHLREAGLDHAIADFLNTGRPMLGICLGMQLLFDESEEDAPNRGLGIIPGQVVRFSEDQGPQRPRIKVPHMGWNQLDHTMRPGNPLMAGIAATDHVYFVHGYYCVPRDSNVVAATCDYGQRADPSDATTQRMTSAFCASVWRDNVWAMQFHPEKSQAVGLHILRNFLQVA